MKDFHIRPDCRLCGASLGPPVLDLGETALANEYPAAPIEGGQTRFPLYLCQCAACGHVQLPVVVKPERLFPPDYPYRSGTNPVFRAHLKEFAATVSGMIPPESRVFEIASNDGTLLGEFRELGHVAAGIDPCSPHDEERGFFSSEWAKKYRDFLWLHKPAAIVALNVFAHVDDLNDFTAGVAALMPEDGLFVFEVGYLPDVVSKGLFDVIYHEHLSYHHLRPLVPFFRRHELELVDAHRVDSQGGSVRCFVQRKRKTVAAGKTHRLMQLLAAEEGLTIEALKRKIRDTRAKMLALVDDEITTMAGFGAPAKLTTMLAALNFPTMEPEDAGQFVIYDDNPLKVGKVTPGTFIPIVPSARLVEDQPDYCIIFSWNFADEIMARNKGYRGKWIVPLPEFRVVQT